MTIDGGDPNILNVQFSASFTAGGGFHAECDADTDGGNEPNDGVTFPAPDTIGFHYSDPLTDGGSWNLIDFGGITWTPAGTLSLPVGGSIPFP